MTTTTTLTNNANSTTTSTSNSDNNINTRPNNNNTSGGGGAMNNTNASDQSNVLNGKLAVKTANEPDVELYGKHQVDLFLKMQQREEFYKRLVEFHKHKNINTPIYKLPTVNGVAIDLLKLYNKVVGMGGWERVCEKDKWSEVAVHLDKELFGACSNGSQALKLIYVRYLSLFEKFDHQTSYLTSLLSGGGAPSLSSILDPMANFNTNLSSLVHSSSTSMLNPSLGGSSSLALSSTIPSSLNTLGQKGIADSDASLDAELNKKKFSYLIDSTPMCYNYNQHSQRSNAGVPISPYENLLLSLVSGLANEIDFAFNTIVLMSSDETSSFKLSLTPRLVELMLAHVGFFGTNDKYNLKYLYDNVWNSAESNLTEQEKDAAEFRKNLIDKYAKAEYGHLVEEYIQKLQSFKKRNFILFWHNFVQMPSELEFNQNQLLNQLMPKLENDCNCFNFIIIIIAF